MSGTATGDGGRGLRLACVTAAAICIAVGWQPPPAQALLNAPIIINSAPVSITVGMGVVDVATLYYGVQPTGQVVFRAFPPGDTGCVGTPAFTSTAVVNGNGRYSSATFHPTTAGTYRFKAFYTGDAKNSSATTSCLDLGSAFVVGRRSPTVRLTATTSGDGRSTSATVSLSGAGPNGVTGTLTFALYGPNNMICLPPALFTSTVQVLGNGSYASSPVTPGRAGTYRWVASYGGDVTNYGGGTFCNDAANTVTLKA